MTIIDNLRMMLKEQHIRSLSQWDKLTVKDREECLRDARVSMVDYHRTDIVKAFENPEKTENEALKMGRVAEPPSSIESNREIAPLMVHAIDEAISHTSDPMKLDYLKKRRAKFAALLPEPGCTSP